MIQVRKEGRIGLVVVASLAGVILGTGCARSNSQAWQVMKQDLQGLPGDLWQDSKELVSRPENLAVLALAGASSGYFTCQEDDRLANHFAGHHTFDRDFTIALGAIPMAQIAVTGTGYAYGVWGEDEPAYKVWKSTAEALILNGIYTSTLKLAANNHSPNGEGLAWPSGHTSTSVTFATVLNEYYGPWVGLPLYALSGLVMYERMETGEHWASDIVFGAAIGYTVGKTVAGKYKPEILGMEVLPYIDPARAATGIAFARQF